MPVRVMLSTALTSLSDTFLPSPSSMMVIFAFEYHGFYYNKGLSHVQLSDHVILYKLNPVKYPWLECTGYPYSYILFLT